MRVTVKNGGSRCSCSCRAAIKLRVGIIHKVEQKMETREGLGCNPLQTGARGEMPPATGPHVEEEEEGGGGERDARTHAQRVSRLIARVN